MNPIKKKTKVDPASIAMDWFSRENPKRKPKKNIKKIMGAVKTSKFSQQNQS